MKGVTVYDSVVIGAGQGGGPLAIALAEAGKKVALIERSRVGGTCVNTGCTPTKTLAASARVAHLVRRAGSYGIRIHGSVSTDIQRILKRKQAVVSPMRDSLEQGFHQTPGLDLLYGDAAFTEKKELLVRLRDGKSVSLGGSQIFLNTGTRAARPDIEGLEDIPRFDHASILELEELPERLLIVGGGYVAVEFGQMFRRFGSEVAIVQRGPRLLAGEDHDVSEEMAKILREEGIEILLNATARRARRIEDNGLALEVWQGEQSLTVTGSHLLIAAGRTPNTDVLNLAAAGVHMDKGGFVRVNGRLETSADDVYAIGDVKGGPAFTHISYDDYRILRRNLLDGGSASTAGRLVPYTVFTDPQLGRVGQTEREARVNGTPFSVAKMPMSRSARAREIDETRGLMKVLVNPKTGRILGAAVLAAEGGEIMSVLQMAMMGNVAYPQIRDGVFAHPTFAESLNNLFASLD